MDRREMNVQVFLDTEKHCQTNDRLSKAIKDSCSKQYIVYDNKDAEEDTTENTGTGNESHIGHRFAEPAKIIVSPKRSFEAASAYVGEKVCVHNFASATNPGGGVTKGSSAQEEALCRCSTLYFCLKDYSVFGGFYGMHKDMLRSQMMTPVYNDDCIFTPGIIVFKSDDDNPKILPESEWNIVDVITCAAPNLRERPSNSMNPGSGNTAVRLTDEELLDIHVKRARNMFKIAKKEEEDILILGAFGCGAFMNSPEVVAKAMEKVVEEYKYDFKVIEFAVYCSPRDSKNYDVFKKIFGK